MRSNGGGSSERTPLTDLAPASAPEDVAEWICRALENDRRRAQYGWPEKLFARLNGALPWLVDRALARQLPVILRHARGAPAAAASLNLGE